jgi:hypothetical protein
MSQSWGKLGPHFVSLKSLRLSFWPETSSSETSGLLRAVTRVFREVGARPLGALSLAVLSWGLTGSAAKAQTAINFPGGSIGVTGHITLENPLVAGSIHLISGQGGWTC